jgi:hypothetical protein
MKELLEQQCCAYALHQRSVHPYQNGGALPRELTALKSCGGTYSYAFAYA